VGFLLKLSGDGTDRCGLADFTLFWQGKPMFWIKFILIAAILLVILLLGVEFSTLHANPVTVNYLLGTTTLPLSLVVVCAFAAGAFVTSLIGAFVVLPLRLQVARLRQLISNKDQEIGMLVRKAGRDAH
jgi:putative membrane protein